MSETTETNPARPHDALAVLDFWKSAGPTRWFTKDDAFDQAFREAFLATHEAAADGRLDGWAEAPTGSLALVILLDQFPRNAFRGTPRAFATDALAREVADRAIEARHDLDAPPELRAFYYLPFMHSEDLCDQERCVTLCEDVGDPNTVEFARIHRDVIQRFGRFPHRNQTLGRQSTDEELAFLAGGGFSA